MGSGDCFMLRQSWDLFTNAVFPLLKPVRLTLGGAPFKNDMSRDIIGSNVTTIRSRQNKDIKL